MRCFDSASAMRQEGGAGVNWRDPWWSNLHGCQVCYRPSWPFLFCSKECQVIFCAIELVPAYPPQGNTAWFVHEAEAS